MVDWKENLKEQAKKIEKECNYKDWDGYDALPIQHPSLISIIQLIDSLPDNIQIPDIIPEPSGNIALE